MPQGCPQGIPPLGGGGRCPQEGQEGALPLAMATGPLLWDAGMLWQSPWQPQYTARRTKLPGEKLQKGREKEGRVEGKKAGKALEQRLGQEGGLGRGNSGGGRWSCLQAALLGMTFSTATP